MFSPQLAVIESETSEVFGSLKTHISSTERPLEVHEENKSSSMISIPCSSLINGMYKNSYQKTWHL